LESDLALLIALEKALEKARERLLL